MILIFRIMANLKTGDIVRYLNSTGGGRVVRIDGNLAYVDEDGFETPVQVRECVVVAHAGLQPSKTTFTVPKTSADTQSTAPAPKAKTPETPAVSATDEDEEIEVAGNEKINLTVAFEPVNILELSTTTFDAFLVNDSNYYIGYSLCFKPKESEEWSLFAAGTVEPNIQILLGNVDRSTFPKFDSLMLQAIAYKRSKAFVMKPAMTSRAQLDTTKFCKLHCFTQSTYFDTRVLSIDFVSNDETLRRNKPVDAKGLEEKMMQQKKRIDRRPVRRRDLRPEYSTDSSGALVVDLHIENLIDNTTGMGPADILNRQIDEFCRVMDANLKNNGMRIVFIHGKGEGVLRAALMKELNHRYRGHNVCDASFREYGYGATQVTI